MANMQIGDFISFKSTNDLSAATNQYKLVKFDSTAQQVVLAAAATDKVIGVLQNTPKAGEAAAILARNASGVGKAVAGGTIAVGDYLASDASGRVVTTTSAGDEVVGIASEAGVVGQTVGFVLANSRY